MQGMQQLWGKKISDYGFANFIEILAHKAQKHNKHIGFIDRWYPSSKTCSSCEELHNGLTLRDRSWTCDACHICHDRDVNAAINIHRVGISTLSLGSEKSHFETASA